MTQDPSSKVAYWRSPDERRAHNEGLGPTPEFPAGADERPDPTSRRTFLKLIGTNLAASNLFACSGPPVEKILPYDRVPEGITPGVPLSYATSFVLDGHATGLLVRSDDGRPTKIEGNPQHPASLGATSVFDQASVLDLYDPTRARSILHRGSPSTFQRFADAMGRREDKGGGLRLLLEPHGSPLQLNLLSELRRRYPDLRVTYYAATPSAASVIAAERVFGRRLQPLWNVAAAKVIVALDSNFLSQGPMHLRHAREFARRRVPEAPGGMSRLYSAEATLTTTGSAADHRLAVRSSEVAAMAASLLSRLRGQNVREFSEPVERWMRAALSDLRRNRGASLVMVGDRQPAEVHAIAHLLNAELGNLGETVAFVLPTLDAGDQDLPALVDEMNRGAVDTLVMLDVDPVYSAPADLEFDSALGRVRHTIASSLHETETSRRSGWFVPAAHYLESWGDARAYDGTLSFIQPLIAPLFAGKTASEMLSVLLGAPSRTAHALLRDFYRARSTLGPRDFTRAWDRMIAAGLVIGSEYRPESVEPPGRLDVAVPEQRAGFELDLLASPTLHDGRFANNPWLLELPSPITKLSWDNALLVSPATARKLGVETEDLVEVTHEGRSVVVPVFIAPGQAFDTAALHLGWGRRLGARDATPPGVNAYPLRSSKAPSFVTGATVRKTGGTYPLATTQRHWSLDGRPHALSSTAADLDALVSVVEHEREPLPSLVPAYPQPPPQWAMSIDLSKCTGCQSCVVACQAENNIPNVGKEDVRRSREMYWLRIDTYYAGDADAPEEAIHQPMLCQHCEKAPCEYVCPVFATTHSPDGLNEMTYNRCIGTRFCSNNCPYKVRRFNWFKYTDSSLRELQKNPDVTVRERGVMEKCTYCVQRIRNAGIRAEVERRPLRDVAPATACQQACPSRAITFGDLFDESAEVFRWRRDRRSYSVLHELGTRPRTQYLIRVKNPSEEMG